VNPRSRPTTATWRDSVSEEDRVAAVRVLARLHRVLEAADSGLTLPQYRVLAAIAAGGVRSANLAERLAVRRPTLTAIADGLVAAGLATREGEEGDRRVVRLHATEAGHAALCQADECLRGKIDPLLDEIDDPECFVACLLAVGAALDERIRAKLPVPAEQTPAEAAG
jgi:DNA-binding MarR family transcriptional regulator